MAINNSDFGNYGNSNVTYRAARATINTNNRMRENEEALHSVLSSLIRVAEDFKKTGDLEFLKKYAATAMKGIDSGEADLVGGFKHNIDRLVSAYENGCSVSNSQRPAELFIKAMLQKRKLLEVKYLKKLLKNENWAESVKSWLAQKSDYDLHYTIKTLLEDYKFNRTPANFEKYNKILGFVGKQIVQVPTIKTSLNDKLVARFAFEGSFIFPSTSDKQAGCGYSPAYQKHLRNTTPSHVTKISDEEFYACDAVKSMMKSKNMAKMLPQLKIQLQKQGVDSATLAQCNVYDFARVLYNAYGPRRQNSFEPAYRNPYESFSQTPGCQNVCDKEPENCEIFSFGCVNSECTEGIRQTFWKQFAQNEELMKAMETDMLAHGVDKNYIKDLQQNIRQNGTTILPDAKDSAKYQQPTPDLTVHHKFNIKDAQALENIMDVDRLENFTAYVDYGKEENNHDLQHIVDANLDNNISERLADINDARNGKNLILSCGVRQNYYVDELPKANKRKTYLDMALEQGGIGHERVC